MQGHRTNPTRHAAEKTVTADPCPTVPVDPVLQAVLEGYDWRSGLPPEDHAEAARWESLESDLRSALRMGPGGLDDARRREILRQAALPARFRLEPSPVAFPPIPRRAAIGWRPAAAAAAVLFLAALVLSRFIPVTGGIDPTEWAGLKTVPRTDGNTGYFQARVFPGDSAQSRGASGDAARPPARGDWAAIGRNGGFQPAAMANVAEIVPTGLPDSSLSLADLIAGADPNGPPTAGRLVNQFHYNYPEPAAGEALSLTVQSGPCPWQPGNRLVQVGLKAWLDPRAAPGVHSIAVRDVRLRVEFNPAVVSAYRMVGHAPGTWQTRRDDDGSGGSAYGANMAPGQSVTMIYEIVPSPALGSVPDAGVLLTTRVIFRKPAEAASRERTVVLYAKPVGEDSSLCGDFQFASAVAACGLLLDEAPGLHGFQWQDALALARTSVGADPDGKRSEFLNLLAQDPGARVPRTGK